MAKGYVSLPPSFSRFDFRGTKCVLKKVREQSVLKAEFATAERIVKWQQVNPQVCRSVCRVVAVDRTDGEVLIILERLHCNVQSTLSQQWSQRHLVRELRNIINALISAQKLSIAHRQISLEHILCTADGQFKLANFARDLSSAEVPGFLRKQQPRYIFPEVRQTLDKGETPQFDNALKHICDMWALGVCFLQLALPQVAIGAELDRDGSLSERFLASLPESDLRILLHVLLHPRNSAPQYFNQVQSIIQSCYLCYTELEIEECALRCRKCAPGEEAPQVRPMREEDSEFLQVENAGKGPLLLIQESQPLPPPEVAFGPLPAASPQKTTKRYRIVEIEKNKVEVRRCKTCKNKLIKIGEEKSEECKLCIVTALNPQPPKPKPEESKRLNNDSAEKLLMKTATVPNQQKCLACLRSFLPRITPRFLDQSDFFSGEAENFCSDDCKEEYVMYMSQISMNNVRGKEEAAPVENAKEKLLCMECNKDVPLFGEALQCSPLHGFCSKDCAKLYVSRESGRSQARCSRCQQPIPPELAKKWTDVSQLPKGGMLKPDIKQSRPQGLGSSLQDWRVPSRGPPNFRPPLRGPLDQKRCCCGSDPIVALTCGHFLCDICIISAAQGENVKCPTCKGLVDYKQV